MYLNYVKKKNNYIHIIHLGIWYKYLEVFHYVYKLNQIRNLMEIRQQCTTILGKIYGIVCLKKYTILFADKCRTEKRVVPTRNNCFEYGNIIYYLIEKLGTCITDSLIF